MRPGSTACDRFNTWFAKPIAKLKELPEGDGGYAALMIALPLYERYIIGKLKLNHEATDEDSIKKEIAADLGLDDVQRSIFWDMCRNGFMHGAMAKAGRTQFLVSDRFGEIPVFGKLDGHPCVCLDPWKFAERVIGRFTANPQLITASESFPLADVCFFELSQKGASESK